MPLITFQHDFCVDFSYFYLISVFIKQIPRINDFSARKSYFSPSGAFIIRLIASIRS